MRRATCEKCGSVYKVPDSVAAKRVRCKKCLGVVSVPALELEEAVLEEIEVTPAELEEAVLEEIEVTPAPSDTRRSIPPQSRRPGSRTPRTRICDEDSDEPRSKKLGSIAILLFGVSFILPAAPTVDLATGSGIGWDYCEGSFNLMRMIFESLERSSANGLPWKWQAYLVAFAWLANIGFVLSVLSTLQNRGQPSKSTSPWLPSPSSSASACAVGAAIVGVAAVIVFSVERETLGLAPVVWALALILGALTVTGVGSGAHADG
jgi:hypothetical protein